MAFDFSTLITDRSPEDLQALRDLLATPMADWTAEQRDAFNLAAEKGAYNFTDFNRVLAAMQSISDQLSAMGYKTGFFRPRVPHRGDDAPIKPSAYIYRYFRMRINAVRSGGEMQMSEIRLMDESGNFYQFPAGTVVSTTMGIPVSDEPPANLIDGLITTKYFTSTYSPGGVITIDLGEGQGADLLTWTKWQWYTANDVPNRDPISFDFEASHDGSGWVTLDSVTGVSITENREALAYTADLNIVQPVDLPDGYTQVEYIESTGTQYINTGFTPNQDTRVVCDVVFPGTTGTSGKYVFGSRTTLTQNSYTYFSYNSKYETTYNTQDNVCYQNLITGRFIVDKNKNITTTNGTAYSHTYANFTCPGPLYLFALNNNGSLFGAGSLSLYSCQIYDNGTIVRNYIPCKDPSGTVGLYDLVGAQFFGNEGSGSFTAGPDVPPAPDPEPERDPYLWYEDDVPTPTAVRPYLANVGIIKGIFPLPEELPEVPDNMDPDDTG